MKAEDHTKGVYLIVTNLQALETVLRYFLAKMEDEVIEFPRPGDTTVKLSYVTRYISLGKLIKTYNAALTDAEQNFAVDAGLVHVRDAIAHGRLVTTRELPFRLWKFGAHKGGYVEIEFSEELTEDWLRTTSATMTRRSKRSSIALKCETIRVWDR